MESDGGRFFLFLENLETANFFSETILKYISWFIIIRVYLCTRGK